MLKRLLRLALLLIPFMAAGSVMAQAWPTAKPIKIVIGFGPGSASDIFARLVGEQLSKALGQSVFVEARPGAAGQIGAEYVARQPADGYTLSFNTNTTHSANPFLFKKLNYDPMKDFTPITRIAFFPFVLAVDANLPINSVAELVAYAKANPQKASYSYSSSTGQVSAAALVNTMRMESVGVAYKSAPEAITAVVGGQVTFTVVDFATSQPLIKAGRLRALAVTSDTRTALSPQLPTIAESTGLADFGISAWTGIFGPANMPPAIVERINAELQKILAPKEMQDRIFSMGANSAPQGPDEFRTYVRDQLAVWERQIRIAGMKAE